MKPYRSVNWQAPGHPTGSVSPYSSETSNLQTTNRNGFRKYFKQVKDEEGNLKKVAAYAPARYKLFTQRRQVEVKFEIKLISTETGEVLLSEVERGPRPGRRGICGQSGARRQPLPCPRQRRSRPQRQIPDERLARRPPRPLQHIRPPRPGPQRSHRSAVAATSNNSSPATSNDRSSSRFPGRRRSCSPVAPGATHRTPPPGWVSQRPISGACTTSGSEVP